MTAKSTLQPLSGPILSAIGDRYYKVTAEALRVCGELVRVLRPNLDVSLYSICFQHEMPSYFIFNFFLWLICDTGKLCGFQTIR
jgi:hypothetical protein